MYLPVYKLTKDFIELSFSVLRSRFGNNDNPNVIQLEHALKSVICINIKPGTNGNCIPVDDLSTKISPLGNWDRLRNPNLSNNTEEFMDLPDLPDFQTMSHFIQNVVVYISGFVGKRLCEKLKSSLPCYHKMICIHKIYNSHYLMKRILEVCSFLQRIWLGSAK